MYTALYTASQAGQKQVVEVLLREGAAVNVDRLIAYQPLHVAAWPGRTAVAELLLDAGAEIDVPAYTSGDTPIHLAVEKGKTEMVRFLLSRGADATIADAGGITPLYTAVPKNYVDIVRLLLEAVDPRKASVLGVSVLYKAAEKGNAALQILLDDGRLPINGRGDKGETALWIAAYSGHRDTVETLLSKGADASIMRIDATPEAAALHKGHHKIAELIDIGTTMLPGPIFELLRM